VLVAAANQIQREPLGDVFEALCEGGESVSIVPSGGSEIAGMFLLRCARLRDVPDVGFVDLKEQAIPAARGHAPLHVSRRPAGSTLPIRTLAEYVHALRVIHAPTADGVVADDPYAETWRPVFSIVEPGAHVATGAVLQDSVVLAGGHVETGSAVARSVVCPRGVVRRGQCIVESMVTGSK
jgi:mannose-1-phosphate guanylyltransferase